MAVVSEIREKMKEAMRQKDTVALDTYRSILGACTNELVASGKSPQEEVSDDLTQKVVAKLIKQRKDAISQYTAGNREDLAKIEQAQLEILNQFMPPQLTEEEVREIAVAKKEALNITDQAKAGILTGAVMKEVSGQADGVLVKRVVDSLFV